MKKPLASIEHTSNVRQLNKSLEKLRQTAILVGIASDSKKDKRKDGGPSNATLGYIHEKGSPAMNIPARPFLVPGVNEAKAEITKGMETAMQAALHDDMREVRTVLKQTGLKTVSSVKSYMQSAKFEPLKPSTIRNRNRSRMTKDKRESEEMMDETSVKPLINTGQLRDAIGFYIEKS